jgi:hypothetical protein
LLTLTLVWIRKRIPMGLVVGFFITNVMFRLRRYLWGTFYWKQKQDGFSASVEITLPRVSKPDTVPVSDQD